MPASAAGIIIIPACMGEYPSATCISNGIRYGIAPLPIRENRLPRMPTRKVSTVNSASGNNGRSARAACSQYATRLARPDTTRITTAAWLGCSVDSASSARDTATMAYANSAVSMSAATAPGCET
jgi:hypothetical protein